MMEQYTPPTPEFQPLPPCFAGINLDDLFFIHHLLESKPYFTNQREWDFLTGLELWEKGSAVVRLWWRHMFWDGAVHQHSGARGIDCKRLRAFRLWAQAGEIQGCNGFGYYIGYENLTYSTTQQLNISKPILPNNSPPQPHNPSCPHHPHGQGDAV
jgi:hypothetical protein